MISNVIERRDQEGYLGAGGDVDVDLSLQLEFREACSFDRWRKEEKMG